MLALAEQAMHEVSIPDSSCHGVYIVKVKTFMIKTMPTRATHGTHF